MMIRKAVFVWRFGRIFICILLFRGILWGMATLVTVARTSCKFTFVFAKHMGLHRSEN